MKALVVITSVVVAASILILLGYNAVYTHDVFTIPIKNSISTDPTFAHMDMVPVDTLVHPYFMREVRHNEHDDSLIIAFNGTYVDGSGRSKFFEYANKYPVNSSFAFGCTEGTDTTYLAFFKYLGTTDVDGRKHIQFWHYDAQTRDPMPCTYPEVLIHSINVRPPQQVTPGSD